MPPSTPTAVLLMAYGSAPSLAVADVRAYLEHILRHYRRASPTDEEVEDLRARYAAIGGSPLYAITRRIAEGVQRGLDRSAPGGYRVHLAMKHSPPFIEDVTREIAAGGVPRAVGLALAPFRSRLSTDAYYALVRETNASLASPVEWRFAPDWHLHPRFLDLWHARLVEALGAANGQAVVVFTNHSLPARIREWNDPYPGQFADAARALAERAGLARWTTAYQSAGGGGVPWLGPTLEEAVREWARRERRFLAAPIGFLMDHLEVLYDLDIAAQRVAGRLGVELTRARMPNDDPAFVELLAEVIRRAAEHDGGSKS